jgi:hypothetical protein
MAMLTLLKKLNRDDLDKPRWVDAKSGRAITPHGLRATLGRGEKMLASPVTYLRSPCGLHPVPETPS